jgi:cytoskeletal protein CcmA (bactofilin family)
MWKQETSPPTTAPVGSEGIRAPSISVPTVAGRPSEEERRLVAWVGKSVVFKGDLSSSEDMTIDGRVQGTVELRDHVLTVGPYAQILGDIVAKSVVVRGMVTGSIIAGDKVTLSETGTVEGDITAPRLALADGAVLRGRVETVPRPRTTM